MTLITFTPQRVKNKRPLYPIDSFSQINFQHESFLVKRFEVERMHNFLGNYNIISYPPALNESMLRMMNVVSQLFFNPVC